MSRGRARVGCSGWSYRDWTGLVYPEGAPSRTWFSHYAALFDTVELNTTFYRLPSASTVDQWAEQAPPGFRYAVKVGQFGTHRKKLLDATSWLPRHLERACRLGPALGPNLFQLPPRWKRSTARLDEALEAAPAGIRWAVELRDPSWVHDEVFDVLAKHHAALCLHDLLPEQPWIRTTSWTYLRFHGPDAVNARYQGHYTGRRLRPIADRLGRWLEDATDVYAYFNNDWHANAVHDARWLAEHLGVAAGAEAGIGTGDG